MAFFAVSGALKRKLRSRSRREAVENGDAFDWQAYRSAHRDLDDLRSEAEVVEHFNGSGRAAGRLASRRAIADRLAELEARYGALPVDFEWRAYLANYPDLDTIVASYAAAEHYLRSGKSEGRSYARIELDLYRSLYFDGIEMPDEALVEHFVTVGEPAGLIASLEQLARSEGLSAWGWLAALRVDEFELLNWTWAGPIANKQEALRAMLREGFERLAPISFAHEFDPLYYAEANPGVASMAAAGLYKHWLFEGMAGGRPGTEADHLARHALPLSHYPEGFDWQAYRKLDGVAGDNRWAYLDHVVANNAIAAEAIPLREPGAAEFLAALASVITGRLPPRGTALFAAARRRGPLSPGQEEQWAGGLVRQERWAEALEHFNSIVAEGALQVPTIVQATRAALALDDHSRAFDYLRAGRSAAAGAVRWREALREAIEHAFAAAWRQAEALYAAGRRLEADAGMEGIVRDIEGWWTELDPVGMRLPAAEPHRFVMLANVDLSQCTHYRVNQKREIFAAAGLVLEVFTQAEPEAFITALPGACAAIFYRLPAMPMNIRAIAACRALGVPSYYDIDDLIFDPAHYPEPIETYGATVSRPFYHSLEMGVPLFRAAMAMCDTAIASTEPLAVFMQPMVRLHRSFVLPNGLDSHNQGYLDFVIPKVRRNDDVVLFYGSGTKAHNSDFLDLVGDPLVTLMRRHPNVRLTIAGYLSLDARFDGLRDRIVQLGWTKDVESYWSLLAEADVAMAVLIPGPTTDCKSEIKWLEAAALNVPSVVSATRHYEAVLEDGVDALLARTSEDWLRALDSLIVDPARRQALVTAARAKARALYGLDQNARRLKALLEPARADAAAKALPTPRKKRILLLNIFFPPQTVGGSTRVARDNLDNFLASDLAADCDFAVVTTDNDNYDPYRMRVDDYKGVPVFRISTPQDPNMEWRPFDPEIGRLFGRVLDLWRPDLVHVHSIQRSTASVLQECWARDIPYINTIHDAWWVSDYHFLVDEAGRLRQPEEPLPLHPPKGVSLGESLERRRRLRILLDHSVEILSVSEAFTAIQRAAGYPRTRSMPNGVPPLGPVTRTRSASGRVRLAQISGLTRHKGYHLVQAALKQGRFDRLELTVLDHERFGGREVRTRWGETPVRFVGKTRQEEMHLFYGDVDVLLVPSVWPESFGLVSREAIAAGARVVASDRGAVGEGVEPGVNGWVIDVSTIAPLLAVLEEINAAPERFLEAPPPSWRQRRTAADQAHEVAAIYRSILSRRIRSEPLPYFMRERGRGPADRCDMEDPPGKSFTLSPE